MADARYLRAHQDYAAVAIRNCRSRGGAMRFVTADRGCRSQPGRRVPFRGETPSGPGSWPAADHRTRQGVRLGSLYGLSPLRALCCPDQDRGAVLAYQHCPRCLARTGTVPPLTLSSSVSPAVDTAAHATAVQPAPETRRAATTRRDAPIMAPWQQPSGRYAPTTDHATRYESASRRQLPRPRQVASLIG
jgi:hypothetical protein